MNVLVTGGSGFVGINVARVLADWHTVVVAGRSGVSDDKKRFLSEVSGNVRWARLDVQDRLSIDALIAEQNIDAIVHIAAVTVGDINTVVDANIIGSLNILQAATSSSEVKSLLFFSSTGVYGMGSGRIDDCVREDDDLTVADPYPVAKYCVELLIEEYRKGHPQMNLASLRLGSTYGFCEQPSGGRPGISQIGRMIDAVAGGSHLKLYGKSVFRDWIFSIDVGEAVRRMLDADHWEYPTYNLGFGEALTLEKIAESFGKFGLSYKWVSSPGEADIFLGHDGYRQPMNMERLKETCGFVPEVSLEKGIELVLEDKGK